MRAYTLAFVIAGLVALVTTPLVRRLAFRLGAVAAPGGRHVHSHSIPRLGGVAIAFAFFAAIGPFLFLESAVGQQLRARPHLVTGLLGGGLAMAALGLADDLRGVRARNKLFVQIGVAVFAYACGIRIDGVDLPLLGPLQMGVFALPITVFWIVGIVNAVNLIDGLDGLAAGVVFFAGLTNFIVAYVNGTVVICLLMAAILGAVLGFLVFNFNPARIFMGDSGSYFLGYALAVSSLVGSSQKASTSVALLVPIIAMGVPIFDTLFSVVRRFLERRPIFAPDRGHIHHRLLDMGITHRRAVLILYGVSIAFAASAVAISLGRNWQAGVAILSASAVLVGLIRFVGYTEYLHQRTRQKARIYPADCHALRRVVPHAAEHLATASSQDELADRLVDLMRDAAVGSAELLVVDGRTEETLHRWTAVDQAEHDRRAAVSARYDIEKAGSLRAQLKFVWRSELDHPSPQADILLQVIADVFQARAAELGARWLPASAKAPAGDREPVDASRASAERLSVPGHT